MTWRHASTSRAGIPWSWSQTQTRHRRLSIGTPAWWPDPRTGELGAHLVTLLAGLRSDQPHAVVTVPSQANPVADTKPVTHHLDGAESAD